MTKKLDINYVREYDNTWKRDKMSKLKEQGVCLRCGKVPPEKGKKRCRECLDKNKIDQQRYRSGESRKRSTRSKYIPNDQKLRDIVIDYYGGKCMCCGESERNFLCVDHINNDGSQHRKEVGSHIYRWLKKNNFPEGFQLLCMNCNWGRHVNNGVCPHQEKGGV